MVLGVNGAAYIWHTWSVWDMVLDLAMVLGFLQGADVVSSSVFIDLSGINQDRPQHMQHVCPFGWFDRKRPTCYTVGRSRYGGMVPQHGLRNLDILLGSAWGCAESDQAYCIIVTLNEIHKAWTTCPFYTKGAVH